MLCEVTMRLLCLALVLTLCVAHNVTPRPPNQCLYTFYVPRGPGGQCPGQEVDQALQDLRDVTDILQSQVTALLGQNTALQKQVAALLEDNGQLRQRIGHLEGSNPEPCSPGRPGCPDEAQSSGSPGATYYRWGRTTCPQNASAVYRGYAAGSHYTHHGGSSQYLCLPRQPQWSTGQVGAAGSAFIYGAEFEITYDPFDKTNAGIPSIHDQSPPCVLCHVTGRSVVEQFVAFTECPQGWTEEYHGYVMMSHHGHSGRTNPVCMDIQPEVIHGGQGNQDGVLFYLAAVICGALPCPNYINGRELACVVCSK